MNNYSLPSAYQFLVDYSLALEDIEPYVNQEFKYSSLISLACVPSLDQLLAIEFSKPGRKLVLAFQVKEIILFDVSKAGYGGEIKDGKLRDTDFLPVFVNWGLLRVSFVEIFSFGTI